MPPQPEPEAVTPPAAPGGVDAVVHPTGPHGTRKPAVRDGDPLRNPATKATLPDETKQGEDTSNRATRGEKETTPQEESPA